VRERNLNLTNTIRTRTLCFVLHFFVLLSFFPNKGTVKHLSLSEKLKCKMWAEMYRDIVKPVDDEFFRWFGGGGIHTCGNHITPKHAFKPSIP